MNHMLAFDYNDLVMYAWLYSHSTEAWMSRLVEAHKHRGRFAKTILINTDWRGVNEPHQVNKLTHALFQLLSLFPNAETVYFATGKTKVRSPREAEVRVLEAILNMPSYRALTLSTHTQTPTTLKLNTRLRCTALERLEVKASTGMFGESHYFKVFPVAASVLKQLVNLEQVLVSGHRTDKIRAQFFPFEHLLKTVAPGLKRLAVCRFQSDVAGGLHQQLALTVSKADNLQFLNISLARIPTSDDRAPVYRALQAVYSLISCLVIETVALFVEIAQILEVEETKGSFKFLQGLRRALIYIRLQNEYSVEAEEAVRGKYRLHKACEARSIDFDFVVQGNAKLWQKKVQKVK
ncbi:hypothetical protein ACM66B_002262 [Microbotryomycetes sp. NB124-2]